MFGCLGFSNRPWSTSSPAPEAAGRTLGTGPAPGASACDGPAKTNPIRFARSVFLFFLDRLVDFFGLKELNIAFFKPGDFH